MHSGRDAINRVHNDNPDGWLFNDVIDDTDANTAWTRLIASLPDRMSDIGIFPVETAVGAYCGFCIFFVILHSVTLIPSVRLRPTDFFNF